MYVIHINLLLLFNNFMSLTGKMDPTLSEEDAKKLILSLDPRVVEQVMQQRTEAAQHNDDAPSLSEHQTNSSSNLDLPVNNLIGGGSVRVRKMSTGKMDVRTGFLKKQKSSVPSLVLTLSRDELGKGHLEDDDYERKFSSASQYQSEPPPPAYQAQLSSPSLLAVDKVETGSVSRSVVSAASPNRGLKKEKVQHFIDFLSMVLSISYGIAIIIISISIYATDLIVYEAYKHNFTEIWNMFLSCAGVLLLCWLIFDIYSYIRTINRMACSNSLFKGLKLIEGSDGEFHIEIPMLQGKKRTVPEYYGFTTGRHAGSFFLKIGAALFCFGHMIHMGLLIVKEVIISEEDSVEALCGTDVSIAHDVIYPLFSLVQLFFVFKYGNVIVNKNKWLARITFMHCLCSSLSFWVNTVINETLDAIVKKYYTVQTVSDCHGSDGNYTTTTSTTTTIATTFENIAPFAVAKLPPCNRTENDISNNVICVLDTRATCNIEAEVVSEIFGVAPWFYPFSIEFNILIVAIWYILWSSIGKIDDHKNSLEFFPSVTPQGSTENLHRTAGHKEAQIVFADCSSSNTGMFFGATMMVIVIVCSLFVLLTEGSCQNSVAITVGNSLQISVLSILTLATLYAYYSITRFDVNPDPISFLDDLLLFFCLPSFFLYAAICFAPLLLDSTFELDFFFRNLLMLVQVLIQTPMIVDGLRRCSNTAAAQRKMRGRNTIAFLIVANLAVYIMETLLIRSYDYQENKIEFYGPDMWTVLSHMTLPICIFYRFHSAVALVDIWTSAYKSAHDH